tara:strand:+ start:406 stop:1116 length:711 start_codon:yes stop_codon:yes gene_type:complete
MKKFIIALIFIQSIHSQTISDTVLKEDEYFIDAFMSLLDDMREENKFEKFIFSNAGKIQKSTHYVIRPMDSRTGLFSKDDFISTNLIIVESIEDVILKEFGYDDGIVIHFRLRNKIVTDIVYHNNYDAFISNDDFIVLEDAFMKLILEYRQDAINIDKMKQDNYKVSNFFKTTDGQIKIGYSNLPNYRNRQDKSFEIVWHIEIDEHNIEIKESELLKIFTEIRDKLDIIENQLTLN